MKLYPPPGFSTAQATAIARGAPLAGFTSHLTRRQIYDAKDVEIILAGFRLRDFVTVPFLRTVRV